MTIRTSQLADGRTAVYHDDGKREVCVGVWASARVGCQGGADEHVQLRVRPDDETPTHVIVGGCLLPHPGAPSE
jgi:hypothetical protein